MLKTASDKRSWIRAASWASAPAVAFAVYANTLAQDFVWDDFYLILEDYTIKSFHYLYAIFTSDFFGHQEDDLAYGYFRPLVSLSYAVDYAIWQTNPFGYHLTNLLLHSAASVLVAAVLLKMTVPWTSAFFAALLFAVHPMHTENAAWISGRTDMIAFVLVLSAMTAHMSANSSSRSAVLRGIAAVLFGAALLAKEMAVVLIPWIAIIDIVFFGRDLKCTLRALLPYVGAVGLYLLGRFVIIDVNVPFQPSDITLLDKIVSAPWTVTRYLAWLVLPVRQSAYVQNSYIFGPGDIRLYAGIAAVAGLCVLFFRIRKTAPEVVALAAMLGVSFLPILNFIAIAGPKDMGDMMAERFLYFPSFPFIAAAAIGARNGWKRMDSVPKRRIAQGIVLIVVIAAASATVIRNRVWKNNEVFYLATLKSTPSALIWCNLADHYIHTAKWKEAKQALFEAKKYFPDNYRYLSATALWYAAQHQYKEAIVLQEKVAAKAEQGRAVAYNNLAYLYRVTGNYKRAAALLQEVIDNGRGYADVYFNLAEVYRATGRAGEAAVLYQKALDRRPDNIQMAAAFGGLMMESGELNRAANVFKTQLEMHRDNPGLLNNLGVVYKKMNRPARARELFEQALKLDPAYVKARLNLAGALLSLNNRQQAILHLEQIVERQPSSSEGKTARKILSDLKARDANSP